MILGRSTVAWMAVITIAIQIIKQLVPDIGPVADDDLFYDTVTALVAAGIALIAQTQLTPVNDARIANGTSVNDGTSVVISK